MSLDEEAGLELVAVVEVFALAVHDAVIVVVATLDPLVVLAALADADAVGAAVAAEVCAVPVLGVPFDEGGGFRRGGGVGGVNCRSIPS